MKQKISISILIIFCITAVSFSAFASSTNRVALVIGNSTYKNAPLANPANDANDMAVVLKRLGFDVIKKVNADQRQMEDAIDKFYNGLRNSEIGLFYYAGHGMQINNANYLIPVRANIKSESDVKYESVHAGRVLGKMRDAGNRLNIVILDACRDNPFKRSFRTESKGLAQMDAPKGSIIVYATSPGALAEDGNGRNGTYTGNLLENIERNDLTVQQVFNETGRGVMKQTHDRQVPWMSFTPVAEFYLAGGSVIVTQLQASNTGRLKIKSSPAGAKIYLNGKQRGTAPKTFSNLPPATYKVKAVLSGYNTKEKRIRVNSGRSAILTFYLDLAASEGSLYVNTDPSGATIKVLNIGPKFYQGMELDAGTYKIKVSKRGYISKTEMVDIAAGRIV
nr:caspase family protein [Desulfobacterales bacterium]